MGKRNGKRNVLKTALFAGAIGLAALSAKKAFAQEKWRYEDMRTPEQIKADSLYWAQKQEQKSGSKLKNKKPEYRIRIECTTPEIQTKDTVISIPIEETKRKEVPFWLGIGLLGLGALGVVGTGISITYKIKNRKFEKGEPVKVFPITWRDEASKYLPIELYVYYPYKLKFIFSSTLLATGIVGIYLLSHSSETKTRYEEQTAQVIVEPVPFIMDKDSLGTHFIVNTDAGWDSTLLHLSNIRTMEKKIKIIFSGESSRIPELRSIFPDSDISIQ